MTLNLVHLFLHTIFSDFLCLTFRIYLTKNHVYTISYVGKIMNKHRNTLNNMK